LQLSKDLAVRNIAGVKLIGRGLLSADRPAMAGK
jgi:hypothetical protein